MYDQITLSDITPTRATVTAITPTTQIEFGYAGSAACRVVPQGTFAIGERVWLPDVASAHELAHTNAVRAERGLAPLAA